MGSTDSLDSGQYSVADEQSPRHRVGRPPPAVASVRRRSSADVRRRRGTSSGVSPPVPAVREHHNRSKSADGGDTVGGGGGCDSGGGSCGSARKTHAKSLSLGDDSFDHKIRMWRKRADSQGSIDRPKPLPAARHHHVHHHRGAPDLVMDLPVRPDGGGPTAATVTAVAATSAVQEATGGAQEPDSPDMGTAAERFAKQNQCTLKKYSKPPAALPAPPPSPRANGKPELPPKAAKPPLKAKPQLFKKPVFLAPAPAANVGEDAAAAASQPYSVHPSTVDG